MILPDVNVLIYAFRRDDPKHNLCNSWLNGVVAAQEQFGMSRLALAALARITTNPRGFSSPSSLSEVFAFSNYLLKQPHCQLIEPGARHWDIFQRLCVDTDTRGPRITDAWYAALSIEWGCEWITFDRDYSRFPGLKWRVPTAN
jgi:toxin-antitoxin system PIN domain toxin